MSKNALQGPAPPELPQVHKDLLASNSDEEAEVVVFVSKMISVPAAALPRESGQRDDHGDVFLEFGRVFSGTLYPGMTVYVLSETYDPR